MTDRFLPLGAIRVLSPLGLRLLDALTRQGPIGGLAASLEVKDGAGFVAVDRKAVLTPSGLLTYPNLGRCARPDGQPTRHYRVRVEAQYYRPLYRPWPAATGVEFDAVPFNDDTDAKAIPRTRATLILLPTAAYPFPSPVPVLRGAVTRAAVRLADARVVAEQAVNGKVRRDRVFSNARGEFALPVRFGRKGVTVSATDPRDGTSANITVNLPADLSTRPTIKIP